MRQTDGIGGRCVGDQHQESFPPPRRHLRGCPVTWALSRVPQRAEATSDSPEDWRQLLAGVLTGGLALPTNSLAAAQRMNADRRAVMTGPMARPPRRSATTS